MISRKTFLTVAAVVAVFVVLRWIERRLSQPVPAQPGQTVEAPASTGESPVPASPAPPTQPPALAPAGAVPGALAASKPPPPPAMPKPPDTAQLMKEARDRADAQRKAFQKSLKGAQRRQSQEASSGAQEAGPVPYPAPH